jgi:predicted nuclease of predicted toxin-antitoxin system
MRLLFDQNLSFRLPADLAADFPGSEQVRDVGLAAADNQAIWEYAARHGLTIISKDADFQHRAPLFGPPPKVVWARIGNCAMAAAAKLLLDRKQDLYDFAADAVAALLVLP